MQEINATIHGSQQMHDMQFGMNSHITNDSQSGYWVRPDGVNYIAATNTNPNIPQMPALPTDSRVQQVTVTLDDSNCQNPNVVRGEEEIVIGEGQGGLAIGDTDATSKKDARILNLMKVYGEGNGVPKDDEVEKMIKKNFRSIILPDVKFVQTGKGYGSFEQQDLTDKHCIANRLFDLIPTIIDQSDRVKAQHWISYRACLKEILSTHKAKATMAMKKKIIGGE